MSTPYADLSDLLQAMFSAPELRRFIRRLPRGSDLADALPEGNGIALLAGEVVDALQRRNRIDQRLFENLLSSAPTRREEIETIARAWGVEILGPDRESLDADREHAAELPETAPANGAPLDGARLEPNRTADVVLLVALEEEFEQLRTLLPEMSARPDEEFGGYEYVFECGPGGAPYTCVARLIGNMGPERAGLFADRLVARWQPEIVVMVGIAATIHDDIQLGDVVVAEQVNAYSAETKAVPKGKSGWQLEPRPRVFQCDHAVVQEVANLRFAHAPLFEAWLEAGVADLSEQVATEPREKLLSDGLIEAKPALHRVHLASGPAVVAAKAFAAWILTQDATIKAVEMEAAGAVEAAITRKNPVRTVVIRGISDLGDDRKAALDAIGKGGLRRLAMRNATRLLVTLLEAGVLPRREA